VLPIEVVVSPGSGISGGQRLEPFPRYAVTGRGQRSGAAARHYARTMTLLIIWAQWCQRSAATPGAVNLTVEPGTRLMDPVDKKRQRGNARLREGAGMRSGVVASVGMLLAVGLGMFATIPAAAAKSNGRYKFI
jgi:hypothetical protein